MNDWTGARAGGCAGVCVCVCAGVQACFSISNTLCILVILDIPTGNTCHCIVACVCTVPDCNDTSEDSQIVDCNTP